MKVQKKRRSGLSAAKFFCGIFKDESSFVCRIVY